MSVADLDGSGGPELAGYLAERRQVSDEVRRLLIEALGLDLAVEEIGLDAPLFGSGLGLDSVDALGLAATIQQTYGVEVSDRDIGLFRSTSTIVDFILQKRGRAPAVEWAAGEGAEPEALRAAAEGERGEYLALRHDAVLIDLGDEAKLRVAGAEAEAFLDEVLAGDVLELPVDGVLQTVALDAEGGIVAIVALLRDSDGYLVAGSPLSRGALLGWLRRHAAGRAVEVRDASDELACLSVAGPRARDVVADLLGEDVFRLSFGELYHASRGGADLLVARFGDTGEYDYRLFVRREERDGLEAGLREAGAAFRLRSCRQAVAETAALEMKSIRQETLPGGALSPLQVDLHWMVHFRKPSFLGRDAVLAARDAELRRAVLLAGERESAIEPGAGLWLAGRPVGTVAAARFSYRLDRWIALALLDRPFAWPGLALSAAGGPGQAALLYTCSAPLFLTRTIIESLNV